MFPTRPCFAIIVCLHANANSSYRDAVNLQRKLLDWDAKTLIMSDQPIPGATLVLSSRGLATAIDTAVTQYAPTHDIFFSLSAHGYQQRGLESDGKDEYIRVGTDRLLDDHLHTALLANVTPTTRVLALIDTCHSGSMLDLPETYHPNVPLGTVACVSACSDSETTGEDISDFGGFGGKLCAQFLDYQLQNFSIVDFFKHCYRIFTHQTAQRTYPVLSHN